MDDLHVNYYRKLFCDWATAASSVPATADITGVIEVMTADETPFTWDVVNKCPANDLSITYRKGLAKTIADVMVSNGIDPPAYATSEDYTDEIAGPLDDLENWKAATKDAGHQIHIKKHSDLDQYFVAIQRCFTYPGVQYF